LDYLFCHALIRDGAYESLLKSRRRQLHSCAAEWFHERDPVLAAQHYDRAEHARAARAYLAASQSESRRYHYDSALALAERGLVLAGDREERFSLTSARALILNEMGQANASIEAWRAALESTDISSERCQALIGLAQGMRIVDQSELGFAALAEAEPLAANGHLAFELSRIHHLRGNYYFGVGRASDCLAEHQKALLYAREVASVEAEANALGGLGDAYYLSGRMRSASEQFRLCVDLAHQHGLGRIEVANKHMVGWSMHYQSPLQESLSIGLESIDLANRVSHRRGETIARLLVAYLAGWLIGDTEFARDHVDAALKICQTLGAKRFEAQNLTYRSMLTLREGDREYAEQQAREALRFSREHTMDFFGATTLGLLARLTTNTSERIALNAEAIERLARGAISHNHFEFYAQAIESGLERGAWDDVEHYCASIERYTESEPLALSDFVIRRGRSIARVGRGERGQDLVTDLTRLRADAIQYQYNVMIPALDEAIGNAT
jgi:tetratricopeptide (TPR) repeat protein